MIKKFITANILFKRVLNRFVISIVLTSFGASLSYFYRIASTHRIISDLDPLQIAVIGALIYAGLLIGVIFWGEQKGVANDIAKEEIHEYEKTLLKQQLELEKKEHEEERLKLHNKFRMVQEALGDLTALMKMELVNNGLTNDCLENIIKLKDKKVSTINKLKKISDLLATNYCMKEKVSKINEVLDKIRTFFKTDNTIPTDTRSNGYPHFFKATYHEARYGKNHEKELHRICYKYPPQLTPDPRSKIIKESEHENATALRCWCYPHPERILVPDVKTEMDLYDKDRPSAQWEPLYNGQEIKYDSMVSEPVHRSIESETKFRGVISVDTDIKGYFERTQQFSSWLSETLHPYAIFIALLYETHMQNELLSKFLANCYRSE